MSQLLEMWLLDYDEVVEVEGGILRLSGVDSGFSFGLEVARRAQDWEDCDRLRATVRVTDHRGFVWQRQCECSPEPLWLRHSTFDIWVLEEPPSAAIAESFEKRVLLPDVYDFLDGHVYSYWAVHDGTGDKISIADAICICQYLVDLRDEYFQLTS